MLAPLSEIFLHLKKNRVRTLLTGFAVGWGVFLLVLLLGVGTGFRNAIEYNVASNGMTSDAVELFFWRTDRAYGGFQSHRRLEFAPQDFAIIKANLPNVKELYREVSVRVNGIDNGKTRSAAGFNLKLVGADPGFIENIKNLQMVAGRSIMENDNSHYKKVFVIPEKLADVLYGSPQAAIGQMVYLDGNDWNGHVIGVYKSRDGESIQHIFIPFHTFNSHYYPKKMYGSLYLYFGKHAFIDEHKTKEIESRLKQVFSRRKIFSPDDKTALRVSNDGLMVGKQLNKVFLGINVFLWIVGLSILSIGVVGVSNIMLVTVSERKRELGLRKALGARSKHLMQMILGESIFITILSGLVGLFAGVLVLLAIVYMQQRGVEMFVMHFMGQTALLFKDPSISVKSGLLAIFMLCVAGLIAGYVPARRACKIPPHEAMNDLS